MLYLLISLATFWVGLAMVSDAANDTALPSVAEIVVQPRFLHLRGYGAYADFKSFGSAPVLAKYCFGCMEIGDIAVDRNKLKKSATPNLDLLCTGNENKVLERSLKRNAQGQVIGERCLSVGENNRSKITWVENKERWSIRASSPELAVEFEGSPEFREWRAQPDRGE